MTSDAQPAWELCSEQPVYDGLIHVVRRTFRMSNDRLTTWDVVAPAEMVAVVALTAQSNVVVVRQFRAGPMRPLYELPGGYVESGETPCDAAHRELREETGYTAGCLALVGSSWVAPDAALRLHTVVAVDCYRSSQPSFDRAEEGCVTAWPIGRFVQHTRSGDFTDQASAYRALDALGMLDGTREKGVSTPS